MEGQVVLQAPLQSPQLPTGLVNTFNLAHSTRRQPLCADPEGWGPISSIRYDFTPCFLDVWILFVSVWGIFFGAGAVWYLLRKRVAQDVPKNWHFYAKL